MIVVKQWCMTCGADGKVQEGAGHGCGSESAMGDMVEMGGREE